MWFRTILADTHARSYACNVADGRHRRAEYLSADTNCDHAVSLRWRSLNPIPTKTSVNAAP